MTRLILDAIDTLNRTSREPNARVVRDFDTGRSFEPLARILS
jgi:hypothetical protein